MLITLNFLEEVQTKPAIETAKLNTRVLNYSVSHTDVVTDYKRSDMIQHIYSYASYTSEQEVRIRSGGYFPLSP